MSSLPRTLRPGGKAPAAGGNWFKHSLSPSPYPKPQTLETKIKASFGIMDKQSSERRKEVWTKGSVHTGLGHCMTEHQLHLLKIWKCSGSCLAPGDEEEEDPIPRVALGKVGRALGSRIRDSPCSLPLWIQQSYNTVTGISLFNKKNHWIIIDFLYTFPLADRQMLGNPGHLPAEIVITEKKRRGSQIKMSGQPKFVRVYAQILMMPGFHRRKWAENFQVKCQRSLQ